MVGVECQLLKDPSAKFANNQTFYIVLAGKRSKRVLQTTKGQINRRVTKLQRANMIMTLISLRIKKEETKIKVLTKMAKRKIKRVKTSILPNAKDRK